MASRLGTVLFWAGLIIGLPLIGMALLALEHGPADKALVAIIFGAPGIAAILIGWACRFVLAER